MDDASVQIGDRSIQMDDTSVQMGDQSVRMDDQSVQMNDSFESKNTLLLLPGNGVVSLGSRANDCIDCPGSLDGAFHRAVYASNKKDPTPVTAKNFNQEAIL
jgi:hypothetical protein